MIVYWSSCDDAVDGEDTDDANVLLLAVTMEESSWAKHRIKSCFFVGKHIIDVVVIVPTT